MAKAKAVMTVEVGFTRTQLNEIVNSMLERITMDFEPADIKAAGVDMKKLRTAVTADAKFAKELHTRVRDSVRFVIDDIMYNGEYIEIKAIEDAYEKINTSQTARYEAEEAALEADRAKNQTKADAKRLLDAVELLRANGYNI